MKDDIISLVYRMSPILCFRVNDITEIPEKKGAGDGKKVNFFNKPKVTKQKNSHYCRPAKVKMALKACRKF